MGFACRDGYGVGSVVEYVDLRRRREDYARRKPEASRRGFARDPLFRLVAGFASGSLSSFLLSAFLRGFLGYLNPDPFLFLAVISLLEIGPFHQNPVRQGSPLSRGTPAPVPHCLKRRAPRSRPWVHASADPTRYWLLRARAGRPRLSRRLPERVLSTCGYAALTRRCSPAPPGVCPRPPQGRPRPAGRR